MNKERINAVADAIEAHPEEFNMENWCGTPCCIAGWAMKLFAPDEIAWEFDRPAEILGLNHGEALNLFFGQWSDLLEITPRRSSCTFEESNEMTPLKVGQVEWIVNDLAELGVKIGDQFFFLYKGHSLVYEDPRHDTGEPMYWRPVFTREFGECCHPINHDDYSKIGTVSLDDSDEWKELK